MVPELMHYGPTIALQGANDLVVGQSRDIILLTAPTPVQVPGSVTQSSSMGSR